MYDLNKSEIMELFHFDTAARVISEAYVASSSGHVQTGDVVHLRFPESNGIAISNQVIFVIRIHML